ncbi:uncharacterized protein LOC114730830 isoform X1 [Neltuma alba]|uniref:uncharacterized protein LOC114730830 isoform X1 n=1 Tax=Neltuma alba TaxID=207710 RepID=UPI0010A37573|nr:uncharacterized protein LOC114730830 isoform X1 [Prosopis alba]
MGQVSGQNLLSTNNQQNNQVESSQATHHSSSVKGQVSEGGVLDWDSEQNNQEESRLSFPAESSGNNRVTIQNDWTGGSAAPPGELLRDSAGAMQLNGLMNGLNYIMHWDREPETNRPKRCDNWAWEGCTDIEQAIKVYKWRKKLAWR